MNRITQLVDGYIAYKHSLDFKINIEGSTLKRFAAFTEEVGFAGSLTLDIVYDWLNSFDSPSDWYRSRLYETVRTFSRYASVIDQNSSYLPKGTGACHGRTTPYILADREIAILMKELRGIYSPDGLRALSAVAAIGLLRATGLRPSECIRLIDEDYNTKTQVITVRGTKFNKSRAVPLSDSAAENLEAFIEERGSLLRRPSPSLFVVTGGKSMNLRSLEYAWMLVRDFLLPNEGSTWPRRPPRLYDIRHTHATRTLERWLDAGYDVDALMPYLSAYLGHVKVADTYWYLTGTCTLLEKTSERFARYAGGEQR